MRLAELPKFSKVYLSGAISGVPGHEEVFQRAEDLVNSVSDLLAVNAAKVSPHPRFLHPYGKYMRAAVKAMMDCDAIYMLEGWEQSQGARVEHTLAALCGMPILYEESP